MRKKITYFYLSMFMILFFASFAFAQEPAAQDLQEPKTLTLSEAYALALKRSEDVAISQEALNETQGKVLQALSTALPHASFVGSETRQDGAGSSTETMPEYKLTLSQPIFTGFRSLAAIFGSKAEKRERRYEKQRAEDLLMLDVTDAMYLFLQQQEDMKTLKKTHEAISERIDELKKRQELGRSRSNEAVSAEANLRRNEAEVERIKGIEKSSRQLLGFLTGLDGFIASPDDREFAISLGSESDYKEKAALRADVLALGEAWSVAKKAVVVAQSNIWPSVNLEGNYYTKRVGASEGIDWDVMLMMDVPIFQGGEAVGKVKEAASRARQAKLRFDKSTRLAKLQVENTYTQLVSALDQLRAFEKAVEASEEDFRLQTEDYRLNLVSNIDVLKTLEDLQDDRRAVIRMRYEAKRLYFKLLCACGENPFRK